MATTDNETDIAGIGVTEPGQGEPNGGQKTGGENKDDAAAKAATEAKAKEEADKKAKEEADRIAKEAADKKAAEEAGGGSNAPQAVEIDGVAYPLDKDGNALGKDGKTFKTKAELDAMSAEGEEVPLVDSVLTRIGIVPKDDKGQPKKYEDTEEGIAAATLDVGKEIGKTEFQKLVDSDPEFKEFVDYKKNGGTLSDFIQKKTSSWSSFKLDENNDSQLVNVVVADLMAAGYDEAQAKQTAELYKDTKRLKEFGKAAYSRLIKAEEVQEQNMKKEFEENQKAEYERTVNHWNSVKETITSGDLEGINIPETDKEAFYQYLSLAVDDKGNSKRNLERSKLPLKRLLQLDYYMYKGFNLSELVKVAVKKENVKSLRERLKTGQNGGVGGGQGINKNNYQKPDDASITLENIM